jgi:hypothetical protein
VSHCSLPCSLIGSSLTRKLCASIFGFDEDQALAAIGQAVHYLDTGGIPVADAQGLETMLRGIKSATRGDDELAREAGKVFDHLYAAYAQPRMRDED